MSIVANSIVYTKFKSVGQNVTKAYSLVNGEITKKPADNLWRGTAYRIVTSFEGFHDFLCNAIYDDCVAFGTYDAEFGDVVDFGTERAQKAGRASIARTREFFQFQAMPGVLMLDHDPKPGHSFTVEQLLEKLIKIHPAIADAAKIVRPSVSARVHKTGENPKEANGFHIYIPVADASDIPRYGKLIFDHLWRDGHGFIDLSASGSMLIRTCIDGSVFQPERIDFIAPPLIAGDGLQYSPLVPELVPGNFLDTRALPNLTSEQSNEVARLIEAAKQRIKPNSADKREKWIGAKTRELTERGMPKERAENLVSEFVSSEFRDLYGAWLLYFANGDVVTVADVFKNPKKYDGLALADPIEGVEYGRTTSQIYANADSMFINSFAHGGAKYFLHREECAWRAVLGDHVRTFNKTHAYVVVGGKARIMRGLEFFEQSELQKIYQNSVIQVGLDVRGRAKFTDVVTAWARHPDRRTYLGGIIFEPNKTPQEGVFNTWTGFAVEPVRNDKLVEPILTHLREVICDGEQATFKYLTHWLAYTFQKPENIPRVAVVMRGKKGTGKGTLAKLLLKIWGNHGVAIANGGHLTGRFNGHLADTCFLFADEAFFAGDRSSEGVLKSLITEPTFLVERKGIDAYSQRNFLKILMATNSEWCVPTSSDERRYLVCTVSGCKLGDRDYFATLNSAIEDKKTQAAFLFWALNLDLSGFVVDEVPDTAGLREQNRLSLPTEGKWLFELLAEGDLDLSVGYVAAKELRESYLNFCKEHRIDQHHIAGNYKLGKYLGSFFLKKRMKTGFEYFFGNLSEARAKFEAVAKVKFDLE